MFRWLTPIILGILTAVNTYVLSQIRATNEHIEQVRNFAIQYTDKMIELILKTNERKR